MADIFISYKREERDRCLAIHDRLVALKFSVWFDARLDLTVPFRKEIAMELAAAKAVLVLWSNASGESDFVQDEASRGLKAGKLVSVRIEDCEIPLGFGARHGGDLIETSFDRHDENWMKVLRKLGELTGRPGVAEFVQLGDDATPQQWTSWRERFGDDPLNETLRSPREQELERRLAAALAEKAAMETQVRGGKPSFLVQENTVGELTRENAALKDERDRLRALVGMGGPDGAAGRTNSLTDLSWLPWTFAAILAVTVVFTLIDNRNKAADLAKALALAEATAPYTDAATPAAADAAEPVPAAGAMPTAPPSANKDPKVPAPEKK